MLFGISALFLSLQLQKGVKALPTQKNNYSYAVTCQQILPTSTDVYCKINSVVQRYCLFGFLLSLPA